MSYKQTCRRSASYNQTCRRSVSYNQTCRRSASYKQTCRRSVSYNQTCRTGFSVFGEPVLVTRAKKNQYCSTRGRMSSAGIGPNRNPDRNPNRNPNRQPQQERITITSTITSRIGIEQSHNPRRGDSRPPPEVLTVRPGFSYSPRQNRAACYIRSYAVLRKLRPIQSVSRLHRIEGWLKNEESGSVSGIHFRIS